MFSSPGALGVVGMPGTQSRTGGAISLYLHGHADASGGDVGAGQVGQTGQRLDRAASDSAIGSQGRSAGSNASRGGPHFVLAWPALAGKMQNEVPVVC